MKKKLIITLLFILIAVGAFVVCRIKKDDDTRRKLRLDSSGNSFGNKENDDDDNEAWVFRGDYDVKRIEKCTIKCEIESGGLVLIAYDNNGYSFLDKDKFVRIRENVMKESGEYIFDFTDLPEGIYSFCITPQTIGDEAYFEYTVEYYEGND